MPTLFSAHDNRYTVAHASENGVILETRQDVSEIIEANKRQFNDSNGKFGEVITHVARLPLTVIDDLNRKGIMRGFAVQDEVAFKAFLNHPDNRFFRTHPGKI